MALSSAWSTHAPGGKACGYLVVRQNARLSPGELVEFAPARAMSRLDGSRSSDDRANSDDGVSFTAIWRLSDGGYQALLHRRSVVRCITHHGRVHSRNDGQ